MPAPLPETFGRYRILKKLGQGGMGAVYLAEDTVMRRKVALKVPDFDGKEGKAVLERFYREARVAAEIRHQGVCPVHDVGEINGVHFLTMAFIEGATLHDLLRDGERWPPTRAVELIRRLAKALHALHQKGIVHRDLKPGNVMIEANRTPVLLDFGLARSVVAVSHKVTAEGASLGTPAYMAPEQIKGKAAALGPHTDVYALGTILFELLTGRLPFQPVSLTELYGLLLHAERPRPSEFADVGAALDQLCVDMLAIDPAQRPATMPHLIARLQRCQDNSGTLTSSAARPPEPPPATVPVAEPVAQVDTRATAPRPRSRVVRRPSTTHRPADGTRKFALIAGVIAAALALAATAAWLLTGPGNAPTTSGPAAAQTTPTNLARGASVRLLPLADLTLAAGETQAVTVRIERLNGDRREVKLFQDGSAEGIQVRLSPIAGDRAQVQINVTSEAGTKPGPRALRLLASVDGQTQSQIEWTVRITPVVGLEKEITNCVGMKFKLIPKGKFIMGSPREEKERDVDEVQHEVEITKPFYMGVYEVSQEEWEVVLGKDKNISSFRKGGERAERVKGLDTRRFPVENVSYRDVEQFCVALNKLAKEKGETCRYRLPTEAEWEYCCRGGAPTYQVFHYGDNLSSREANFDGNFPYGGAAKGDHLQRPVAVDDPRYKANGFGLYHMHGNVWEWCSDWYGAYPTGKVTDPEGPNEGTSRVSRGGSWIYVARNCRTAIRFWNTPDSRNNILGFRLVRVPSGGEK